MFDLYLGEIFIGVASLLMSIALALGWGKVKWQSFCVLTGVICFLTTIFSALGMFSSAVDALGGVIEFNPLFSLIRVSLCISAIIVIMISILTNKIEDQRKPEQCLFVLFQLLFALFLIASDHLLISYVCLGAIAILNALMIAMPFHDRAEGEAAIKYWFQFLPVYCLGFGSLVVVALLAESLAYGSLGSVFTNHNEGVYLVLLSILVLPFWVGSGLFPFHMTAIDANHGASWSAQASNSLITQPATLIAMMHVLLRLNYGQDGSLHKWILGSFAVFGLVGGFWGLLSGFTQQDSKRFFANFSLAAWSICLIPIWSPGNFSIGVIIFHCFTVSISLSILCLVLSTFHEQRRSDQVVALQGMGRRCIFESFIALAALASLAGLPPLVGFPSFMNFIGVFLEQNRIWVLFPFFLLALLMIANVGRILKVMYFDHAEDKDGLLASVVGLPVFSRMILLLLTIPLLGLGVYWDALLRLVLAHASSFLG